MTFKKNIFALIVGLFSVIFSDFSLAHSKGEGQCPMHSSKGKCGQQTSQPSLKLSIEKIDKQGDKNLVQIRLLRTKDNKPVTLDDLKVTHTEKIHLLIINETLEDYSHIHPKATGIPGIYEFEWELKGTGKYTIWADLFPLETNTQEYVVSDLTIHNPSLSKIDNTVSLQRTIGNLHFTLSFVPEVLKECEPAIGKILIQDINGNPVKNLEPVMGAFAHIVGFGKDFKTVIHSHPMGEEPTNDSARGGPELKFQIIPQKAGFIKLFVQVSINGEEIFVPFGVVVEPAK